MCDPAPSNERGVVRLAGDPEVLTAKEWLDPLYRRANADVARLVISDGLRDRTTGGCGNSQHPDFSRWRDLDV